MRQDAEFRLDLGDNIPPTRLTTLDASLHPALSDLLIEAATQVHGRATLMRDAGQIPTPLVHDSPISSDAARCLPALYNWRVQRRASTVATGNSWLVGESLLGSRGIDDLGDF